MFLLDWWYGILSALGLYYKSGRILFLGLDNAGKTTLLQMLKYGRVQTVAPTLHPSYFYHFIISMFVVCFGGWVDQDELIVGNLKFETFDLGGHESARKLWRDYFSSGVDGIVFMVDACDRSRFTESM